MSSILFQDLRQTDDHDVFHVTSNKTVTLYLPIKFHINEATFHMNASNRAKEGSTLQFFQRTPLVTLVKTKHGFLQNEPDAWSDVNYSLITTSSSAIVSIAQWNDCAWIDRNNPNEISRYINIYDTSIKIVPHSMQLVVPLDFEHCDVISMVDKSIGCLPDRLHTFSDILRRLTPLRRSGRF